MTIHQLFRANLDSEADESVYFEKYLGIEILDKLKAPHIDFEMWPRSFLDAFRALSRIYAQFIPEADHVIRADVDTKGHSPSGVQGDLFMYFGYQCSGNANRSQYTGVTIARDQFGFLFSTFIGGGADDLRRSQIIREEDPNQLVESRIIRSYEDVERLAVDARSVIEKQRAKLINQKGTPTTAGFCPEHCRKYWHINSRLTPDDASIILWEYFKDVGKKGLAKDSDEVRGLLSANNGFKKKLAISYIQGGILPEEAIKLALMDNQ